MPSPPEHRDDRTVVARGPTAPALAAGTTLINGNYVIEAFLARGGMGEVYRARHVHEGDSYAIKVILPEIARDEKVIQLFRREARELKRVNSDAIVRYRDFLSDAQGACFLIMEFVDGEPLARVLQRRGFEPAEVFALLDRIGGGLAAVHEVGIVHRDISPENIILPGGDISCAKLIDFGIAKSADPADRTLIGGDFAGKMSFVSPEQADPDRFGRVVDRRSDIYSLGLVLAAAALGFGNKLDMGGSLANVVRARQSVPDLKALPASLRPLIGQMLQPRPQDRPGSMRAVLDEAGSQARRLRPAGEDRPRRPRWRQPALWLGAALAAAVAVLAGVLIGPQLTAPPVVQVRSRLAAITGGYQCAELASSVTAGRAATVSGYVESAADLSRLRGAVSGVRGISSLVFNVQPRVWPFCKAAALLKPYLAPGPRAARIRLLPAAAQPVAGSPLVLDLRTPDFDSYVYVDYFRADGEVLHLFPNDEDWFNLRPARNRFVLGRPPMRDCWNFAGAPGEQMITLVASRQPLFSSALPADDHAKDYLRRLKEALGRDAPASQAAAVLFYDLHPGEGSPGAAGRCSGR